MFGVLLVIGIGVPTLLNIANRTFKEILIPRKKALGRRARREEPRMVSMDMALHPSEAMELAEMGALTLLKIGQDRHRKLLGEGRLTAEDIKELDLCECCYRPKVTH